jgi:hypothetical protein
MTEFSQEIEITGIIMPHNWDENGRIIEIAIYTDTEDVFGVEHNRLTQELKNLMHRSVEVKGIIRIRPDGNRSIAIQNYTALEKTVDDE